jgi:hypothetical protein
VYKDFDELDDRCDACGVPAGQDCLPHCPSVIRRRLREATDDDKERDE